MTCVFTLGGAAASGVFTLGGAAESCAGILRADDVWVRALVCGPGVTTGSTLGRGTTLGSVVPSNISTRRRSVDMGFHV